MTTTPDLDRCLRCSSGVLDSRIGGGMCGDWRFSECPGDPEPLAADYHPAPDEVLDETIRTLRPAGGSRAGGTK